MIFEETKLKGAFIIKPERNEDERGSFARVFCEKEFNKFGLNSAIVQSSISYNKLKGTFRGMHFQTYPFEEEKIVTCIQGAMIDIIVDLRPTSPTFKESISIELSADNGYSLYVPKSFAQGFVTLQDHTKIFYQMTQFYQPQYQKGFRLNDHAFDILFPFNITTIAQRDKDYPDFKISDYAYELTTV